MTNFHRRPALPRRASLTGVQCWADDGFSSVQDLLVREEPLEIWLNGEPLTVTMRTPGHDLELTAGLLYAEQVIHSRNDILELHHDEDATAHNRVLVEVPPESAAASAALRRTFYASSSCGICGRSVIEELSMPRLFAEANEMRVAPRLLCALPERLRSAQALFSQTGALHAAGLFTPEGELLSVREDVGRHNAVDKLVGWAVLERQLPLGNCILLVSGRGGYEIAQKAVVAGVPLLACISAPSDLAVRLARKAGMTLVGFLREKRFVVYAGASRLA